MMIEIKHKGTDEVLYTGPGDSLGGTDLEGLALRCADLEGLDLTNTDFARCDLSNACLALAGLDGTNFSGADLVGANFTGADSSFADFSEANLKGAVLDSAWLVDADFTDADLEGASFKYARIKNVSFENANLENVDFSLAELAEVDFEGANLEGTKYEGTVDSDEKRDFSIVKEAQNQIEIKHRATGEVLLVVEGDSLEGADLQGASLRYANLGRANLRDANLRDANLEGADLWSADLRDADLSGASLEYANLVGADLWSANLSGANLRGADLRDANLKSANLRDASLEYADLRDANLEGANLEGTILEGTDYDTGDWDSFSLVKEAQNQIEIRHKTTGKVLLVVEGASLEGTDLQGAGLSRADLSGANLRDANLQSANLRDASLEGASLEGTDLSGADLERARLRRAGLEGADLSGANLWWADLRETDLVGANLEGACLRFANLRDANLEGAGLSSADLSGASLEGTNLKGTILEGTIYDTGDWDFSIVKEASVLDPPRETLPPDIWDLSRDPPRLQKQASEVIQSRLLTSLGDRFKSVSWVTGIFVIGSSAGYYWEESSDIDVSVIVDVEQFKLREQGTDTEDPIGTVGSFFMEINEEVLSETEHPLNFYAVPLGEELKADAVYDVLNDEWVKSPRPTVAFDFDTLFEGAASRARDWARVLDLGLGEAKRDVVDYKLLGRELSLLSPESRATVKKKIKAKIEEINDDVEDLVESYESVRDQRIAAFVKKSENITGLEARLLSLKEEDIVRLSVRSVVIIQGSSGDIAWSGSGFLLNDSGQILTCLHVAGLDNRPSDESELFVSYDGQNYEKLAGVIAMNSDLDVTVLAGPVVKIESLKLGDSDSTVVGEPVVALGSPEGVDHIALFGRLASDERQVGGETPELFIDVEIKPGSSGGPVLTLDNLVIGIARGSIGEGGLNYVIPINPIKEWLNEREISYSEGVPGIIKEAQNQIEIRHKVTGRVLHVVEGDSLEGASLSGANLEGADLWGAGLSGADLRGADLENADLSGASLWRADLKDANLRGADLSGASLWSANLRDANLESANLRDANLEGANLKGANLSGANLEDADLRDTNFEGANLEGTILEGTEYDTGSWDSFSLVKESQRSD